MSIYIVRLVASFVYVFRPILASNHYCINKTITYENDPMRQKWNGFAQYLLAVVVDNTDVAVLTVMSTLKNVSIDMVYFNVVYGITQVVLTTVNGLRRCGEI